LLCAMSDNAPASASVTRKIFLILTILFIG
jgi:hypothetical protein